MTLTMTRPPSSAPSAPPEPRWSTPASPGRQTIGPQIAAIAKRLGLALMPWQQLVADVGGELVENKDGVLVPAYREVIVTVPRQSGKTGLALGWEVQRAIGWGERQEIAYSAQTGADARKKLLDDQEPVLYRHRRALRIASIRRTNGNEAVVFTNGSRISVLASSAEAGHGRTLDLGIKDEFFADYDDRRDQALVPAMATRQAAQVLTTSTMGTEESIPLNRAVERGRLAASTGQRSGIAYFEWSAPDGGDPDDPVVWRSCMPALGITISEEVVRHARMTLKEGEFRRAFLNQYTHADQRVIPRAAWDAVCSPDAAPTGRLAFSVDVNPERSVASIAAAGGGVIELVARGASVGWVPDRAVELNERWGRPTWFVDAGGPAGSLLPDLERAGLTVHPVSARELIDACARFYDDVMERKVQVRRHPDLDLAVAAAAKRQVGDAWAWTRRNAATDVSPLVAATLTSWGAQQVPKEPRPPPLLVSF